MRKLILLLFAVSTYAQTPTVVQTQAARWGSGVSVSLSLTAAPGNTLDVECNVPSAFSVAGVTDSLGDAFSLISAPASIPTSQAQFEFNAVGIKGGVTKVTCTANKAPGNGEIYVRELAGVDDTKPVDVVQTFSDVSGKAIGSIKTQPDELVLASVISGTVTNASGWTPLSSFDSNLMAAQSSMPEPALMSASFGASSDWVMTLAAYRGPVPPPPPPPTPLQVLIPGLSATLTFPIASAAAVPACLPSDGVCSITIQWSGPVACDTASPPNCTMGAPGILFFVKTVTLPTPQTVSMPIVSVSQ